MDKVTKVTPQQRVRQETGARGVDTFQLNPMIQPIVDMRDYSEPVEIKTYTLNLTAASGTHVGALYADNGERLRIHCIFRGATTGYSSATMKQEKDGVFQRLSISATAQLVIYPSGIIVDEGSIGMLTTGDGADSAITLIVTFSRINRET